MAERSIRGLKEGRLYLDNLFHFLILDEMSLGLRALRYDMQMSTNILLVAIVGIALERSVAARSDMEVRC